MLLHFGSVPVLVVSSDETAREIMKTHDITFANRPKNTFFKKFCYNFKDEGSAPYEEETKSMIDDITKHCSSSPSSISSAFNLSEMLETLTNDVICRVALGRKYSDGEECGRTFKKLAGELTLVMSRIHIGDYIPWLAWIARLNGLDPSLDGSMSF
ncbi:hypothetical protein L3X38_023688 [Prunus dulcis]|uniref:Uncharacterized protein n=1 Tax=Prunus dulcis TaxID=3755 RepID=A0AAD4W0X2_PRUDU|nr:hypothetical protein L3X38_023688 [Prunus dulcis]